MKFSLPLPIEIQAIVSTFSKEARSLALQFSKFSSGICYSFQEGGCAAGTFTSYPTHSDDKYTGNVGLPLLKEVVNSTGKKFTPSCGPKEYPIKSTLTINVQKYVSYFLDFWCRLQLTFFDNTSNIFFFHALFSSIGICLIKISFIQACNTAELQQREHCDVFSRGPSLISTLSDACNSPYRLEFDNNLRF